MRHSPWLGFTQFKRHKRGNLQVDGTERPGVPAYQGSATDSEKPSDASQRWRRTRAMASTKVGDGLSYQAAVRWVMGWRFCNAWAARVVQEKRPSRTGVVRAMARSDHWPTRSSRVAKGWVSTPR